MGNTGHNLTVVNYDLDVMLSGGSQVSIKDEEFESIILKSIDRDAVGPVITEIRTRREKLKIKHLLVYSACFVMLSLIAQHIFPHISTTAVDDAWEELNVELLPYDKEPLLVGTFKLHDPSPGVPTEKMKMTKEMRINVFKYRLLNMKKVYSDYMVGYDSYIGNLSRLFDHGYDDIELKECFIEGVLKSFSEDGTPIGLKSYAEKIRKSGDDRWTSRGGQIRRAIVFCQDILEVLCGDNGNGVKSIDKKVLGVKLQQAQLYMYQWLVANVEKTKGRVVKYFPDDRGDRGVEAREKAVDIILNKGVKGTREGRELYNQCIDILVDDTSMCNSVYFNGESSYGSRTLEEKRLK